MELPNWQVKRTELSSPITEHALVVVGIDRNANYHPIGSAVFIAAGLAMTAKHVIDEFWRRMGPGTQFAGGDEKTADFNIMLIQYPNEGTKPALWQGSVGVGASFTDVFFLSVFPANELAESYRFTKTPMINVLPPAVGELVAGFGYAASEVISGDATQLTLGLNPCTASGIVSAIYPEYRDRGMLTFPCFEINTHFIGGMSGGPLFNERGQLCGLICSSLDGEPIAYGATLWPAMGTAIEHQGPGMICKGLYPVFEMATAGLLHLTGWDDIVQRIEIQYDPFGKELMRLKKTLSDKAT